MIPYAAPSQFMRPCPAHHIHIPSERRNTMTDRNPTLRIGKMACAACSARIEKRLARLAGITDATVNLTTEEAHITYDDTVLTEEKIIAVIEKLGFTAETKTAPPTTAFTICFLLQRRLSLPYTVRKFSPRQTFPRRCSATLPASVARQAPIEPTSAAWYADISSTRLKWYSTPFPKTPTMLSQSL